METTTIETETDVLVVGGGGAGFRAAIAVKGKGPRTLASQQRPPRPLRRLADGGSGFYPRRAESEQTGDTGENRRIPRNFS